MLNINYLHVPLTTKTEHLINMNYKNSLSTQNPILVLQKISYSCIIDLIALSYQTPMLKYI